MKLVEIQKKPLEQRKKNLNNEKSDKASQTMDDRSVIQAISYLKTFKSKINKNMNHSAISLVDFTF